MIRALIWKEWREQRSMLLAGLLIAILSPLVITLAMAAAGRHVDPPDLPIAMLAIELALIWPLFAAIAGAGTIAHERGEGTLDFLLTRPVGRGQLWSSKVLLALACWGGVVAGTSAVTWLVRLAAGERAQQDPWLSDLAAGGAGKPLVAFCLLLFGASVLCSTLVTRPMTAAGAGLCLALAIGATVLAVWQRLELFLWPEPEWVALEMALVAALLLGVSLFLFVRADVALTSWRKAVWLAVAMALGVAVAVVPVIATSGDIDPARGRLLSGMLSPAGDALVTGVVTGQRLGAQVWVIPTDGRPIRPLARRLTWPLALSPDGEWAVYLSARGLLGLRSDEVELRMVQLTRGEDHLLAGGLRFDELITLFGDHKLRLDASAAVSPDNSLIALLRDPAEGGNLLVASLEGEAPRAIELTGIEDAVDEDLGWVSLIGWTADAREVLLSRHVRLTPDAATRTVIEAVRARTGEVRSLLEIEARSGVLLWSSASDPQVASTGITVLPFVWHPPDRTEGVLELLDVRTGSRTVVASGRIDPFRFDLGERALAYVVNNDAADAGRQELHVLDLVTGQDEIWSEEARLFGPPRLAPDGRSVAFARGSEKPEGVAIVGPGRVVRTFEGSWVPIGWSGANRLVLESYLDTSIAVADLEQGTIRTVFPPPS